MYGRKQRKQPRTRVRLKSTYESKKRKVGGTTKSGKNPFEITKYDRTEVASQIKKRKL